MKKFRFELQNILKYRQSLEDQERQLLTKAMQELESEETLARQLSDEKQQHLQYFAGRKSNIISLRQQETYLSLLDFRIKTQLEQVDQAKKASDDQRIRVITAASNRRILESLKEKKQADYNQMLSRAQQNFLDEVGVMAYCRKETDERR